MALRFAPARGAASIALSTAIRGPVGAAATIAMGTTSTLAAGAAATGSNSGNSAAATFNFGIPRGADAGMRYAFEASTSMAAPASGGLRLNNAAIASVTAIAVNAINSDAIDVSDYIATWDDSTSSVKGYVEVRKEGSGAALGLYRITSVTDNATWLQFAVTYISGSGSFTAADSVYLVPFRTGDAGTGDFSSNTATSVDGEMLLFSGTAGKTGKRSTLTGGLLKSTSGVPAIAAAGTDYYAPGSTDVAVADGGTGASTAGAARTNLGSTTVGDAVFIAANAAAAQSALSLVPGTNVEAFDAQLFSNIPINSQSAAYGLVLTDGEKCIYHPPADTTARIWTIPANASVAFPVGTVITIDNDFGAGVLTISITTDTLVLVGAAGSTGSRTLASGGQAVIMKVSATRWRIGGVGLT